MSKEPDLAERIARAIDDRIEPFGGPGESGIAAIIREGLAASPELAQVREALIDARYDMSTRKFIRAEQLVERALATLNALMGKAP